MKLIPITCAQCDAPIRVKEGATIVVCEHCETQLHVQWHEDGYQTEVVEEILKRTEALAKEVKALKAQKRLRNLDQHWRRRRRILMDRRNPEQEVDPAVLFPLLVVFGCCVALFSEFWWLGFLILILGGGLSVLLIRRKVGIERARQSYRRRRRRLVKNFKKATKPQISIAD